MKEAPEKQPPTVAPVYLKMEIHLVRWLDQEARRQRRSRAFVMAQACRLLQAVREQWAKEESV